MRKGLQIIFFFSFIHLSIGQRGVSYFENPSSYQENLEALLIENAIDSVRNLSRKKLAQLNGKNAFKEKGLAYYYLGEADFLGGELKSAQKHFLNAIESFKSIPYLEGQAAANCKLATICQLVGENECSKSFITRTEEILGEIDLPQIAYDLYCVKAKGNLGSDQVYEMLNKALHIAFRLEDTLKIMNIYGEMASNFELEHKIDSAIVYFEKGVELHQIYGDTAWLTTTHHRLGDIFKQAGDYGQAQGHLIEALKYAEASNDPFTTVSLFTKIGEVYAAQESWDRAYYYADQGLLMIKNEKIQQYDKAINLKNQGDILVQKDNQAGAILKYREAFDLFKALNIPLYMAAIQVQLNRLDPVAADPVAVRSYLQQAKEALGNSINKLNELEGKLLLSKLEGLENNYEEAFSLLKDCVYLSRKMGIKTSLRDAYLLLSDLHSRQNNHQKAFQYFQKYTAVKDSLMHIDQVKEVNKLDMQYQTEKKDKELAERKVELERKEAQIQKRNFQLTLLICSSIFATLIAGFIYFIYFKNEQLNKQRIAVLEKERETQRLRAVIEGEEKERKRVARDLHDGLGALLSTVKMQISGIQNKLPEVKQLPTFQKAETLIDDACKTVREISHNMMPHILEQYGLEYAIQDSCALVSRSNGIEINFIPYGVETVEDDAIKVTIYRVVQELLKNVVKHSGAEEVIVQLTVEDDQLNLIVEDDGQGMDQDKDHRNNGIGLENIRSRVEMLNGAFQIDSKKGEGSTFTVDIPIKKI